MTPPNRSCRPPHSNLVAHRSVKSPLLRSTHHHHNNCNNNSNNRNSNNAHPRIKDRTSTLLVKEGLLNRDLPSSHNNNDMVRLRRNKGLPPNSNTDRMGSLRGMDHLGSITVKLHRKDMDNTEAVHLATEEGLNSQT